MLRNIFHLFTAYIGSKIYRNPSRKLFVIGVTGTKGKSTAIALLRDLLIASGARVATFSSVHRSINTKQEKNTTGNSMPGRFHLQRFFSEAVQAQCTHAVVEVTSEGVLQHRHRFIAWDAAVFTNLTPEHIERHGSFEKYRDAKVSFFRYVAQGSKPKRYAFLNSHDPNAGHFEKAVEWASGMHVIHYNARDTFVGCPLLSNEWLATPFNMENAAAAVSYARSQGVSWEVVGHTLNAFNGLAGRMELIQREPFMVVIDYAHTPHSLESVYRAVRARPGTKRLLCVFGACGGGRDKWKRPEFGKIAGAYCDEIFLTNEDPFDEDPRKILQDIERGIPPEKSTHIILDRGQAIREAIASASIGDAVVITGKGSEQWIRGPKGGKIPWSDREVVLKLIDNK